MRKADKNEDNKMTLKELKHFLRQINVEVDDVYAEEIFKVETKDTCLCLKCIFLQRFLKCFPFRRRNATCPTQGLWKALKSNTSTKC